MSEKRVATIYDYARALKKECLGNTCTNCPISSFQNGEGVNCEDLITCNTDKFNEILLKWCDEHPIKTFNDDFMEKFPKAMTMDNMGKTSVCKKTLYGGDCILDCKKCWNQPYEEDKK